MLKLTRSSAARARTVGSWFEVRATAYNSGDADATGVVPVLGAHSGSALVALISGPVPASRAVLAPGASQEFVWTFSVSGVGVVGFSCTVTGTDSDSGLPISDVSAWQGMMGVYPPGSVVQLTDERFALVVSVNSARPLKPSVIVHDPHVPQDEALVIHLEEEPKVGIRRSLKPLKLPKAAFDYLSPRKRMCYFFERARETALEGGKQ